MFEVEFSSKSDQMANSTIRHCGSWQEVVLLVAEFPSVNKYHVRVWKVSRTLHVDTSIMMQKEVSDKPQKVMY